MLRTTLIILMVLAGAACKTSRSARQETARFELQKTPCFGKCPEFTFTLEMNGKATYHGLTNVSKTGAYMKTFTAEEVRKAIDTFESAQFWSLKDKYVEPGVTDLPSVYITFEHNGKKKKIEDQFNSPKELKALEKYLEDMANSEGWIKTGTKSSE